MLVYLIRHATAEDPASRADEQRTLTERGRQEARDAGRAMAENGARLGSLLSSPLIRARETAEELARVLDPGLKVKSRPALACGASGETFLSLIRAHPATGGELAIVAHNPDLGMFASSLAGQAVSFQPSTVCCFDLAPAGSRLVWIRHPSP